MSSLALVILTSISTPPLDTITLSCFVPPFEFLPVAAATAAFILSLSHTLGEVIAQGTRGFTISCSILHSSPAVERRVIHPGDTPLLLRETPATPSVWTVRPRP